MIAHGVLLACLSSVAAAGEDDSWPQWRGPALNGTSSARDLPVRWSETENVKWKVKLPSWSGSTPAIWGDRIFAPSPNAAGEGPEAKSVKNMGGARKREGVDLLLLCLSRKDGSELWRAVLPGANQHIGYQNMSSPSPVTDGKRVWWLTGTGILTALDMNGKPLWRHDLQKAFGPFGLNWGYASSPLFYEGKIIVQVLHGMTTDDPSYLVCFDAASGKLLWKVDRPTDSPNEGPDAYTTPFPLKIGDRVHLIVSGGDYVTGHDPATGRELWRMGGFNPTRDQFYRQICTPGAAGEILVSCIKKGPTIAFRAGGQGIVTQKNVLWTSTEILFDVPSPVSDGTYFYILGDSGLMSCVDAKTGEAKYKKERLPRGTYWASPLLADGKIYVTNTEARTTVLAAGPEFKVLSENKLDDDYTLSSIAVSGPNLFIRTSKALYCIGP